MWECMVSAFCCLSCSFLFAFSECPSMMQLIKVMVFFVQEISVNVTYVPSNNQGGAFHFHTGNSREHNVHMYHSTTFPFSSGKFLCMLPLYRSHSCSLVILHKWDALTINSLVWGLLRIPQLVVFRLAVGAHLVYWNCFSKVCVYVCIHACMFVFPHSSEQSFRHQKQPLYEKWRLYVTVFWKNYLFGTRKFCENYLIFFAHLGKAAIKPSCCEVSHQKLFFEEIWVITIRLTNVLKS